MSSDSFKSLLSVLMSTDTGVETGTQVPLDI